MGTEQHPVDCVVCILGSITSALLLYEELVGRTKSGRGTIDMSGMAMLGRGLRLYRIRRGCYRVSPVYLQPKVTGIGLTSSSRFCTPIISALFHDGHIRTYLINELSLT
jgi:hypothetical protein